MKISKKKLKEIYEIGEEHSKRKDNVMELFSLSIRDTLFTRLYRMVTDYLFNDSGIMLDDFEYALWDSKIGPREFAKARVCGEEYPLYTFDELWALWTDLGYANEEEVEVVDYAHLHKKEIS